MPSESASPAPILSPAIASFENPATEADGFFLRFFLDLAHRAACVAIFATLIGGVVLAMAKPEREILAIAFGGALLAGAIAGAIWPNPAIAHKRRCEARNLIIMSIVVLALTSMLMAFGHIAEKSREASEPHGAASANG